MIIKKIIKYPVRYIKEGTMIWDSEDNFIIDIRGWGRFENMQNADKMQNQVGEFVANAINEKLKGLE